MVFDSGVRNGEETSDWSMLEDVLWTGVEMLSRLRPSLPELVVCAVVASVGRRGGRGGSSVSSAGEWSVVMPKVLKIVS